MITVVIPTLNESENIASIVSFVRRNPKVTQVIVVDDGSIDGTPEIAQAAGAVVLASKMMGKGVSMDEGVRAAVNEIVLYLDGDMHGLRDTLVDDMTAPLLAGEADLVKAKFSRAAGRVTVLVGRPLLRVFFPELARFDQPLGGVVAARCSLLHKMKFENDYGVDVGLLIDAAMSGARVLEVDIGSLEHHSRSLEALGDMAAQVVRTILRRAAKYKRLGVGQLEEVEEIDRRMQVELATVGKRLGQVERLALLDMDGTLVKGRFAVELARRTGAADKLRQFLDNYGLDPDERARQIAALFAGVPREAFLKTAMELPLVPGAADAVVGLRKLGYRVGVVTDGYFIGSDVIRRRVFADFSIGSLLRFQKNKCTGQLTFAPAGAHPDGCPLHRHCKFNVLKHLVQRMSLSPEQVLAVGDDLNDVCLLAAVGTSIAFDPKADEVRQAARYLVQGSLTNVLPIAAGAETAPRNSELVG
jgi:phosphoserine phosphatase